MDPIFEVGYKKFQDVGEENQQHNRELHPVDIAPENRQDRQKDDFLGMEFEDIKEHNDKKITKRMRSHQQGAG
jgi:hypothetical protein